MGIHIHIHILPYTLGGWVGDQNSEPKPMLSLDSGLV